MCFRISQEISINADSQITESSEKTPVNDPETHLNPNEFSCVQISFNNSILMKSTCLPFWQGEIVHKCTSKVNIYENEDVLVKIPATNMKTKITYRNMYCAICNMEENIELWNFNFVCVDNASHISKRHLFTDMNITKILEIWDPAAQEAESSPCNIEPMFPTSLEHHAQFCSVNSDMAINQIYNFQIIDVNSSDHLLPRSNICDNLAQTPLYDTLCRNCTTDMFYKLETDFSYISSDMVFICDLERYFLKSEWRKINSTHIHICGGPKPSPTSTSTPEATLEAVELYLTRQGEVLIMLFLVTFMYHKVEDLPKKILFSQTVALFCVRAADELENFVPLQYVHYVGFVYHYFCLSCNSWKFISTYNVWFVLCHLTKRVQIDHQESHAKRYLIYFLICQVFFPVPIVAISVLIYLSPVNVALCTLKLTYNKRRSSLTQKPVPFYLFHTVPAFILHVVGMTLFTYTCYFIFNSVGDNRAEGAPRVNNYILLLKLSRYVLIEMLDLCVILFLDVPFWITKHPVLNTIRWCVVKSYGTLTFFLFAFPWDYVVELILKCKKKMLCKTSTNSDIKSRGTFLTGLSIEEESAL